MPKFTKQEKINIRQKLIEEGEKLFSVLGLKKVTIDDLSNAAKISHSAFYSFYESKEELFMEININKQKIIYEKLDRLIHKNCNLEIRKLAKLYIITLQKEFFEDKIISLVDSETLEQIYRKVSPEVMQKNDLMDKKAINNFINLGIEFNYSFDVVIKLLQAGFLGMKCFEGMSNKEELTQILVDSLIEKIIKEKDVLSIKN